MRRVWVEIPVYERGDETTVAVTDLIETMERNGFTVLRPLTSQTMFVLTKTWREGEYDYAEDKTEVLAVSETPGPLIQMVYELTVFPHPDGTFETVDNGTFKISPAPVAVRKDG